MLETFANYIVSKRFNAIWVAVASILIVIIQPLAFVVMCLVSLRRGVREGAEIASIILFASIVLTLFFNFYNPSESVSIAIGLAAFNVINCFSGAFTLKKYNSAYLSLQVICLVSFIFIVVVHFFFQELAQYWIDITDERIRLARTFFPTVQPMLPLTSGQIEYMRTHLFGMYSVTVTLSSLGYIFFARYLEAKTFEDKLLQPLYLIRGDYISIIIALAVYLGNYFEFDLAENLLIVALLPLMLAGLSIVHHYAINHSRHWLLIICFYLMFLSFPEYLFYGLAVLAGIDVFFNIRGLYNGYNITRDHSRRKS